MTTFIIVMTHLLTYAFMGGLISARHYAITSAKCRLSDHTSGTWCGHLYASVWLFGLLWPLALPIAAGTLIGSTTRDSRTEKRRTRELEEAKHQAELARLRRIEDEELDRQLQLAERKRRAV